MKEEKFDVAVEAFLEKQWQIADKALSGLTETIGKNAIEFHQKVCDTPEDVYCTQDFLRAFYTVLRYELHKRRQEQLAKGTTHEFHL